MTDLTTDLSDRLARFDEEALLVPCCDYSSTVTRSPSTTSRAP